VVHGIEVGDGEFVKAETLVTLYVIQYHEQNKKNSAFAKIKDTPTRYSLAKHRAVKTTRSPAVAEGPRERAVS